MHPGSSASSSKSTVDPPERPRAAIVAVAKNEGIYLHEWIAYHRLLGFDELLVYDNDSTDGSTAMLAELEGQGLVTPVPWHVAPDESPQATAYVDGLRRLGRDFGWVAFIDLDEFFVLARHASIQEFLAGRDPAHALGVNWKNFGSSGLEHYDERPVIERFRRCSARNYGRNRRVKVIAHTSMLRRPGVHSPRLERGGAFLDVTGVPISDGRSERPNLDVIRLNHYYTKSQEEWTWKAARGRGGKPSALLERKHWYPDFAQRDVNDDVETDIVRRLPALRDLMERTRPQARPGRPPTAVPEPTGAEPSAAGRVSSRRVAPVALDDEQLNALALEAAPALGALGWSTSRQARRWVDERGFPVPQFTYAAIAFLRERSLPGAHVLSYGGQDAASFWAEREAAVAAVVTQDKAWNVPPGVLNIDVNEADEQAHVEALAAGGGRHDVITLDGDHRLAVSRALHAHLTDRGVVVLNNSERSKWRPILEDLERRGFRLLGFHGLGPRLARVWRTSIAYRDDNVLGL